MPLISFITQPFQFVVHALDRLRYRWKFATLATVLVAAAVLLLQQMYADYREQVAATEREIAGLALSQQALDLLVNFQLQRGIAYSSMLGGGSHSPSACQCKQRPYARTLRVLKP
ncbi:hypothetical protein [Acidovorax temperans]|uniref:hypothetical protein n=1 Tax=Acidovorax temperans TaxID=80878 RepID=UPI001B70BDEC|nr:hypothetical protein [Acidovorax temperans]MBP8883256.1 hypothetical protein [Pseudomonas sp.]